MYWGEESVGFCSVRSNRGFAKALWGLSRICVEGTCLLHHPNTELSCSSTISNSISISNSLRVPGVSDLGKSRVPQPEMSQHILHEGQSWEPEQFCSAPVPNFDCSVWKLGISCW